MNTFISLLFGGARAGANVRAVRRGRIPQRAGNIIIGRTIGRLTRRLWL